MRRFLYVMVLLLVMEGLAYSEVKVNSHSYDLSHFPLIKTDPKGNVYVAYYSKEGDLYIKKNDEPEVKVAVEGGKGDFIDLTFFKDEMVLTRWHKLFTAEKFVYVQRSTDEGKTFSKPVTLNTTSYALPPIHVTSDGGKRLYVVWVDERQKYSLYMNYSVDGGKTFLDKDISLTTEFSFANLPYLLVDGDTVHLFFLGERKERKDEEKDEEGKIFYKQSKDGGKTWSDALKIRGLAEWTPSVLQAVKSGENILVFWAGVRGMAGAYSKNGTEWKGIEFKDVIDQDINRIDITTNKKGNIFISTSWKKWGAHFSVKPNVYFYRSEDNGLTWSGPQRLNRNEYDNTSSFLPSLHVRDDGTIFVAWQDHRDIRGAIYINYSKDSGKTWLEKDISMDKSKGRDNNALPFVANYKDKYYILWLRYADDRMMEVDLIMEEYKIK